jgi:hypothetical protein
MHRITKGMQMRVAYKLSENDLLEAHGKNAGIWTKAIRVWGLLLILVGLGSIALHPKQYAGAAPQIILGAFFWFGLPLLIRRAFRKDNRLQQPLEAVVSESGIEVSSPTASSKYEWSAFTRYAESKNLFFVYQAPKVFNVFPKRAFALGEEESFRALLSARLGAASVAYHKKINPRTWIWLAVVAIAGILLVMTTYNTR